MVGYYQSEERIFYLQFQLEYFLMVDIETNPLYYAAAGGIILGLATSLHYILKGNVTGMSGIVYGIASLNMDELPNKLSIVGGLLAAGGIFFDIFRYGTFNGYTPFGPAEDISEYTSYLGYALAGLLVGFGTKLGNGCTSGHGLCGLARLSFRSFVAVGIFLSCAIAIGTLRYYETLGPFTAEKLNPVPHYQHLASANIFLILGVAFPFLMSALEKSTLKPDRELKDILRDNGISFLVGLLFGIGLLVAGMTRRRNILQFLWLGKDWNPSLLFVLGCGVFINLIVFNYMIRVRKSPVYGQKLFNPTNSQVDWKLIVGAACFGLGWGIGGLCPGPFMVLFAVFQIQIHVVWFATFLIGMFLAARLAAWDTARIQSNKVREQDTTNKIKQNQQPNQQKQETNLSKIMESNEALANHEEEETPKPKPEPRLHPKLDHLSPRDRIKVGDQQRKAPFQMTIQKLH